jgi:hypothetical protein
MEANQLSKFSVELEEFHFILEEFNSISHSNRRTSLLQTF